MKKSLYLRTGVYSLMVLVFALSCEQEDAITIDRNIEISNDEAELNKRLTLKDEPIGIVEKDGGRVSAHFKLTLKGELLPPVIDGKTLQASSMYYHWGNFLASYNYQGEEYLGAVDFISADLRVLSEVLFRDADIHAVTGHDRYAYLSGAKANGDSPAYIERFLLDGMKFSPLENGYRELGSYAATSVIENQGKIVVTTGNDGSNGGGVYKLDRDLNVLEYLPVDDARWLSASGNDLFVGQGTPGTVSLLNANKLAFDKSYPFEGAYEPEAKTTVEVADNRIFLAGGQNGVIILDKKDGTLLHTITFSDTECITNAVSAENGLLFISNGQGGAYVASYNKGKVTEAPVVLGKIAFGESVSVNHILFRNYKLWVASGLGGVKMVDIEMW